MLPECPLHIRPCLGREDLGVTKTDQNHPLVELTTRGTQMPISKALVVMTSIKC